jgi:hypothetical protein
MPYTNMINEITSRKYHAYSDEVTAEAQKLYDCYFKAAAELEERVIAERIDLDTRKASGLSDNAYRDALQDIDARYENDSKRVFELNNEYESGVNELKARGYDIQLTFGIVYAVLNRYQESPETDELNELYASVMAAKKEFSTIMTEKYRISTAKGLDSFVQGYIRELYDHEKRENQIDKEKIHLSDYAHGRKAASLDNSRLQVALSALTVTDETNRTDETKAEITRLEAEIAKNNETIIHLSKLMEAADLRISRLTQLEIDLKVDLYKANIMVALKQQKKLEHLITRFNNSYKKLCESHPEMRSPCVMQDLDGRFYADLFSRDLDGELKKELAKNPDNRDKNEIARLQRQIETRVLIEGIDEQSKLENPDAPANNGVDKFGVKIEVLGQVINWFIIGPLDQSTQKFRDIIYLAAANSHAMTDGCTGYYRGSNSLHVKRHHTKLDDALYNHNHYRFEREVTPDMLGDHMNAIIMQEHGGNILNRDQRPIGGEVYMSMEMRKRIVDTIVSEYEGYYKIFTIERSLKSAIDMHNEALIMQVIDQFMQYANKTKKFDSKEALKNFIHRTITNILLKNGITQEMLIGYGAGIFSKMVKEYPVQGSGGNYIFSFADYLEQYAVMSDQCSVPPQGYNHYKMLFDQTDGDGDSRKFSQRDIYNNSADRKLTLDDEQELKVAKAHEDVCKNLAQDSTRAIGSFKALFRSTHIKINFGLVHAVTNTPSSFYKDKPVTIVSASTSAVDDSTSSLESKKL